MEMLTAGPNPSHPLIRHPNLPYTEAETSRSTTWGKQSVNHPAFLVMFYGFLFILVFGHSLNQNAFDNFPSVGIKLRS